MHTIKSRFMVNCGCKFTLFANKFSIKKGKFDTSFCLHRKGHVDVTRISEFLKILQVIIRFEENKNIVNVTSVKNRFKPVGQLFNQFFYGMTEMRWPGRVQEFPLINLLLSLQ